MMCNHQCKVIISIKLNDNQSTQARYLLLQSIKNLELKQVIGMYLAS